MNAEQREIKRKKQAIEYAEAKGNVAWRAATSGLRDPRSTFGEPDTATMARTGSRVDGAGLTAGRWIGRRLRDM